MKRNKLRNIGIIAHVDAGKTTVTERILYYTGESHNMGDVHNGNTRMDFDPHEQARGITIYSAATSVYWNDHKLNIIDTPGHIDFNIEVKRSLRVLDGAVVVFDSVAGVEPQSETNWHLADEYGVPRICFVNKMDRIGADYFNVVNMIETRLGANPLVLQLPIGSEEAFSGIIDLISLQAITWQSEDKDELPQLTEIPKAYQDEVNMYRQNLLEAVSEFDDEVLHRYIEGKNIDAEQILPCIREATLQGKYVPILCGSAFKNKGVQPLLDAIVAYLPSPEDISTIEAKGVDNDEDISINTKRQSPFSALAFKIVNDKHGSLTFVRVYSGKLEKGDTVLNTITGRKERISRIYEMHANTRQDQMDCQTGDIVALVGLKTTLTGHTLCDAEKPVLLESITVPTPVIEMTMEAASTTDQDNLVKGLLSLVQEDPSLAIKNDPESGQQILAGMGELQLENVLERLQRDYHVQVNVGKPKVAYRETISQQTVVHHVFKKQTGGPGQFAEVKIVFEPLQRGSGFVFESQITGGNIPQEYIPAVKQGIEQAAEAGLSAGYPVVDFKASLLDGSYHEQDSSSKAFETAAMQAFRQCQAQAAPVLLEPVMTVEVTTPLEYLGDCIGDIHRRRGQIKSQALRETSTVLKAEVPLVEMFGYIGELRAMTSGRGNFTMQFDHYDVNPAGITSGMVN